MRKLELPEDYTNFKPLLFKVSPTLFAPVSTYDIGKIYDQDENKAAVEQEIAWLEAVSNEQSIPVIHGQSFIPISLHPHRLHQELIA